MTYRDTVSYHDRYVMDAPESKAVHIDSEEALQIEMDAVSEADILHDLYHLELENTPTNRTVVARAIAKYRLGIWS